jgi:hypothetical protein
MEIDKNMQGKQIRRISSEVSVEHAASIFRKCTQSYGKQDTQKLPV